MPDPLKLWSPDLAIGIDIIDQQHYELIRRVEVLITAIKKAELDRQGIINLVLFMQNYVVTHFSTEENFMKKIQYGPYDHHKEIHDGFKKVVAEVKAQIIKYPTSPQSTLLVEGEIVKWYVNHIKIEDKKIARALAEAVSAKPSKTIL